MAGRDLRRAERAHRRGEAVWKDGVSAGHALRRVEGREYKKRVAPRKKETTQPYRLGVPKPQKKRTRRGVSCSLTNEAGTPGSLGVRRDSNTQKKTCEEEEYCSRSRSFPPLFFDPAGETKSDAAVFK